MTTRPCALATTDDHPPGELTAGPEGQLLVCRWCWMKAQRTPPVPDPAPDRGKALDLRTALTATRDLARFADVARADLRAIAHGWNMLTPEARVKVAEIVRAESASDLDLVATLISVGGRWGEWEDV